jgi:hypothetical protein
MKRKDNWEAELSEYINSKRGTKAFAYGKNDCASFASGAVIAITGEDPIPEFRGQYKTARESLRALKEHGAGNLEKTIDGKFAEIEVGQAGRGDLAFFDGSVGVIVGQFAWFVGEDGLERVKREYWDKAWSVARG